MFMTWWSDPFLQLVIGEERTNTAMPLGAEIQSKKKKKKDCYCINVDRATIQTLQVEICGHFLC